MPESQVQILWHAVYFSLMYSPATSSLRTTFQQQQVTSCFLSPCSHILFLRNIGKYLKPVLPQVFLKWQLHAVYWVTLKMASFLPRLNPIYNEWFRLPVLWHLKCSVLKHQLSLFVLRRIFWKNKVIVGIFEHEEGWTKFGAKMYYLRGAGSCGMLRKRIQRHSHR